MGAPSVGAIAQKLWQWLSGEITLSMLLGAGNANIGNVGVLTIAAGDTNIGNVDIASSLPAGTNVIGDIVGHAAWLDGTTTTAKVITNTQVLGAGDNNIGNVDVASIAAGDNNIGNVDVASISAGDTNIGNVDIVSIAAGDTNIGNVDIVSLPDEGQQVMASSISVAIASNQSNVPVSQATASNLNAEVQGDAAHDAAASGNPVLLGAQMETMADSAPGTRSSTDGDATKIATLDGAFYVIPTGPQIWSYHENSSSALTDAAVHAAPAAGLSLYVTDIIVSTGAATAFNVFFEEGASTVLGPYYLEAVAGRGFALHFGTPKKITATTALTVTTSAAIAHGIDLTGFISPG